MEFVGNDKVFCPHNLKKEQFTKRLVFGMLFHSKKTLLIAFSPVVPLKIHFLPSHSSQLLVVLLPIMQVDVSLALKHKN